MLTNINTEDQSVPLAVNKAIGGATKPISQHTKGEAADLESVDNARLFFLIRDNFDFDQLIWDEGDNQQPDWVHVSYKAKGNRKQILNRLLQEQK